MTGLSIALHRYTGRRHICACLAGGRSHLHIQIHIRMCGWAKNGGRGGPKFLLRLRAPGAEYTLLPTVAEQTALDRAPAQLLAAVVSPASGDGFAGVSCTLRGMWSSRALQLVGLVLYRGDSLAWLSPPEVGLCRKLSRFERGGDERPVRRQH